MIKRLKRLRIFTFWVNLKSWPDSQRVLSETSYWTKWVQTWHGWTWRVNLPTFEGPTLIGGNKKLKYYFLSIWNLTRRFDQKVNECSQRPPIGPNGFKLDMGGPEGSIYPYLRVRPWLKVIWVRNIHFWTWKLLKTGPKIGLKMVRKDFKLIQMVENCSGMDLEGQFTFLWGSDLVWRSFGSKNIALYWNKWNYFVRDSNNHSKAIGQKY